MLHTFCYSLFFFISFSSKQKKTNNYLANCKNIISYNLIIIYCKKKNNKMKRKDNKIIKFLVFVVVVFGSCGDDGIMVMEALSQ